MMSSGSPGWLGWIAMTAAMLAFWTLVIIGIASLLDTRPLRRTARADARATTSTPADDYLP